MQQFKRFTHPGCLKFRSLHASAPNADIQVSNIKVNFQFVTSGGVVFCSAYFLKNWNALMAGSY